MSTLRPLSATGGEEEEEERNQIHRADQAWTRKGRDLTENGKICLSKALLSSCDPARTGQEVYAEYFFPFTLVDEDSNLSCLKARPNQERKIRNTMYNLKEPSKDPAYFNFTSHTDLNRLAKAIKKDIVVYYAHDDGFKIFEIYHDFRGFSQKCPPPATGEDGLSMAPHSIRHRSKKIFSAPCLYYVLTVKRKLYKFEQSLDRVFMAETYFFAKPETSQFMWWKEDYGGMLSRTLGLPAPEFPIPTLLDLAFSVDRLYELWKVKIILVTFCKSNFNQKEVRNFSRRLQPRFSYFFNLGIVAPPGSRSVSELDLDGIELAVCFYGQRYACILQDEFRREVINQYKSSSRRDKPSGNNFASIPIVSLEERRLALAKLDAEKKARKRKLRGAEKPAYKRVKVCDCSTCRSDAFDLNMNVDGPERLCSYYLDVSDLLQLLGADTETNLVAVEELCKLSVAAMDIESMTLSVNLEPPVREGGGLNYSVVDGARLEGHFKKVQKPIMIAHLDELDLGCVKVFQASSDAEESIYQMMRDYWAHVQELRNRAKREKLKIAEPLLALIADYKNAHFEVYSRWVDQQRLTNPVFESDMTGITKAWMSSFPGQLERRLLKLITEYTVFSFYG